MVLEKETLPATSTGQLFGPGRDLDTRCGLDLDMVVTSHLVNDRRDDPTQNKDSDDHYSEETEVQIAHVIPGTTS